MNTPHTTGPWYVEHIGGRPYVVDQPTKNFGIAEVHGVTPEKAEANARLIASAPELLEALERLTKAMDDYDGSIPADIGSPYHQALAAVSKAKGGAA